MSLRDDITSAQIHARKNHLSEELSILQMALSAIKNEEIEKREILTEEDITRVLQKQVKQLRDAQKDFETASRDDLVQQTKTEIHILSRFLPQQMNDDEIARIVDAVIAELGSKEFPRVMGETMKRVQGRANGSHVQTIIKQKTM